MTPLSNDFETYKAKIYSKGKIIKQFKERTAMETQVTNTEEITFLSVERKQENDGIIAQQLDLAKIDRGEDLSRLTSEKYIKTLKSQSSSLPYINGHMVHQSSQVLENKFKDM